MKNARRLSGKTYCVLLILIAVLAVFLRVYRFGDVPGGFNQDGLMAAVDAKALADHGTDRFGMRRPVHFTAWGFGQMSVLMSYLTVPFIRLFGLSVVTARLPCLLASLMGLVFLYFFSRDCFGKGAALSILFLAALCPWHIMQSRWALDCNLFPHFFMAGVRFLYPAAWGNGTERKKAAELVLSMVMFALSMYCYGVSLYTVPVFLIAACIVLLSSKRIPAKRIPLAVSAYLLIAWPFLLCMIINAFSLNTIETPLFTIPFFPSSVRSSDILFFAEDFWGTLKQNFLCAFRIIAQTGTDSLCNQVPGFSTLYKLSAVFLPVGLVSLVLNLRKREGSVLALLFLLAALWCGLITSSVNVNRFNIVFYPLIILSGLGIYEIISRIRFSWIPVAAAYLIFCGIFARTYFTTYADDISRVFMKDFGEAVSSLKNTDAERIFITPDFQYQGSAHVSEILTLYYMDIDAEYFQGKTLSNGHGSPEIPYNSRFVYRNVTAGDIRPGSNDAFVVTNGQISLFDTALFRIEPHGGYYTVTPK